MFLLFTKIFLNGCLVSFFFKKNKVNCTNILKAPSRHKQFFHQVFYEFFQIKVFFNFTRLKILKNTYYSVVTFEKLDLIFQKVGSNILTRTKVLISFVFMFNYLSVVK